ncbi:hypothetical protein DICPUDRAFT_147207 [Dictyostelium purpureum]|uniref:Uncharacterized protein n=1 Tax=Dictyostelium purpureum TaxID=5786 RepID=F0Z7X8_DICPU|nr:uncharacterized protein DICPUDRAFT_147207 [Dictyostelium purpureum]EGC39988.1 hypothetical protein DICPUDRAFT_147207 [Dictyostelium purpureum]|eukprot:XP_003283491.1 hypothetical protein DICPUDRAFT_147207 [Dictyostelium purpureum]
MTFNNIDGKENDDIAIIGLGFRFPGGSSSPNEFWNNMINKFDGISKIPEERWSKTFHEQDYINNEYGGILKEEEWRQFDPLFFGISPKEAPSLDPQQRLLMISLWEALEDAHIKPSTLRGSDTGVFIGMMNLDYQRCQFRDITTVSPYTVTGNAQSFISNRLSFSFDLRGPSMTVDTACSSSLNAVYLGCQAIATGDCKMAVVGGVNGIFDPTISMSFSAFGMLGHKGQCRSFDADADGFIRGEGAGVIILKKYSDAIKDGDRVYCLIKGGSSNVDGYNQKTNITAPSKKAQSENIEIALKKSNVDPSEVYYIEAHGTGTPVGDPIEIEALSNVFKSNHSPSNPLYIGSVKSNMGHLESAAGIASMVKCALMLKHRTLIPNIHFDKPNPLINFEDWNVRVVTDVQKFPEDKIVRMGVNSFGLSGSNCHMILEEAPIVQQQQQQQKEENTKEFLVPFSGNTKTSLNKFIDTVLNNQEYKNINFKDFVKHQSISRSSLVSRKVVTASSWEDLLKKRNEVSTSSSLTSTISTPSSSTPLVFVFVGQGPQWKDMLTKLYETEPIFKQAVDDCDKLLEKYFGYSILEQLRSLEKEDSPEIHHPKLAQPSIFLVQVGLVALYKAFNITPSIVVGHSFGEVTAALYSGVIDLETAAKIVYHRSTLQNLTIGSGRLMSIGIGDKKYIELCGASHPNIEIACYNDPNSIVITGSEEELNQVKNELSEQGVFCAFLGTPCSFHSSKQEQIKDQVFNALSDLPESSEPKIPFFSTITGKQSIEKGFYNCQYIYDNLRQPVNFTDAISNIYTYLEENEMKNAIFVEIGPHPTLGFYIPKCKPSSSSIASSIIVSPLHKKKEVISQMKIAISTLYCNGVEVDFSAQFLNEKPNHQFKESTSILPRYQWDNADYWTEPTESKLVKRGPSKNSLGHDKFSGNSLFETFIDIRKPAYQFYKGHKIKGKYLFPGSGYIDNIIRNWQSQDITIYNLEFKSPFFLTEGIQHHLQTSVVSSTKGEFKVEFFVKDNKDSTTWTKTSNGRVGLFPHNYSNSKRNIQELKKRCSFATLNKSEVYGKLLLLNLPYGPTFQRVEQLEIGDNVSLAKLEVSPSSHLDNSFFNASILDCALHGLLALGEGPQEVIFDRLQDLKVYHSNIPANQPSHVYVFSKLEKIVGNSTHGSIEIMLEDGTLLVSIKQVKSTSLLRIKKPSIKYPSKDLYSHKWQLKESSLEQPNQTLIDSIVSGVEHLTKDKQFNDYLVKNLFISIKNEFNEFSSNVSNIDEELTKLSIDSKNTTLFTNILQIVKNENLIEESIESLKKSVYDKFNSKYSNEIKYVEKKIRTIVSTLKNADKEHLSPSNPSSPLESPRKQKSLANQSGESVSCDNSDSEEVSNESSPLNKLKLFNNQNEIISNNIQTLFRPLLASENKSIYKIIDFSTHDNTDLTISVLEKLNNLIKSNGTSSLIEYTLAITNEASLANTNLIKEITKQYQKSIEIKYRSVSFSKDFSEQNILSSNYDLVISSFVLNNSLDIKSTLSEYNNITLPNGQLFLLEQPRDNPLFDIIFSECSNTSNTIDSIKQQLYYTGYNRVAHSNDTSSPFVFHAQKMDINSTPMVFSTDKTSISTNYENFIFVTTREQQSTSYFEEYKFNAEIFANNYQVVFTDEISSKQNVFENLKDQDLIIFIAPLESLTVQNYKQITMDYVLINQIILKNSLKCRLLLVTLDAQNGGSNYFNSSLIGTFRYFLEFPSIISHSIDVDRESIDNFALLLRLFDTTTIGDNELIIRKNKVFVQKIFKEPTLLKSNSYEKDPENIFLNTNSNLEFTPKAREEIPKGHVEIKVMATGINYKDNLFYRGLLPQEIFTKGDIYSPPFGLECSGIVTRVSSDVGRFKVGDKVVGFASHSLSSHVIASQDKIIIKPEGISFVEAAAVCVVYATSYYAIYQIGSFMTDKESIMVHSATGGVGLATLNILKWKRKQLGCLENGPAIYATVGSKEKVEYLNDKYGSLITNIYNSRDTEFSDLIMSSSDGVDLILNTLSGDYLSANFRSLSQVGRIMDLSVTQLVENDGLDISNFKYHVGYNTVDLERAAKYNSTVVRSILTEVFSAIEEGSLENIPIKVFPATEVKTAIEYINERVHIGKVVIDFQDFDATILKPLLADKENPIALNKVKKDKIILDSLKQTILVTGQTGIAIHILKWIISSTKDVTDFIILSRSSMKWELQNLINQTKHKYGDKFRFHYKSVNVVDIDATRSAIKEIYSCEKSLSPIKTVFHFATVYEYILPEDITQKVIDNTHDPKSVGAYNLHTLSVELNWNLDNFVLFSSIGAIVGGSKQCAYSSANFVLDSLAQYRKSQGLNAISVNWGALDAGGVVAIDKSVCQFLKGQGINLVSLSKILGGLDAFFQTENNSVSNVMLSNFNIETLLNSIPQMKRKMDHLLNNYKIVISTENTSVGGDSVQDRVIATVSELLSIDPSKINLETRLKDYGIDSLLTVQLKNWIDKEFAKNLFTHLQLSSSSINQIIQRINGKK